MAVIVAANHGQSADQSRILFIITFFLANFRLIWRPDLDAIALADGCIPQWGRVSGYLWGVTLGCSACYSGQPQIWVAPRQMGCIQDFWRASRPILSATRGAGETPAIPGEYAIISDAPMLPWAHPELFGHWDLPCQPTRKDPLNRNRPTVCHPGHPQILNILIQTTFPKDLGTHPASAQAFASARGIRSQKPSAQAFASARGIRSQKPSAHGRPECEILV